MERVDVQKLIDAQPFGRQHWVVAALCAASVMMDGFDAQATGFVAPALAAEWGIARAALSPVLSAGLLGMLVGALTFGPLADRFGRRPILILCTLWFGAFTLLTSQAESINAMVVFRLITGFGLGGTLPNAIALTSEYMPQRLRATGVMLMFSGFSIGAAIGGFVSAGLIADYGWRAVFVVGGALPCLVAAALVFALPESARFLVLKGGQESTLRHTLQRLAPAAVIPADATYHVAEHQEEGFVVKRLFTEGRSGLTLLLWVVFFMSLLDLYFLNSWLPTVISDSGIPLETAILITAMFQVGGSVGAFVLGRFFDRSSSFRALAWTYVGASACVVLIGAASVSVAGLFFAVFAAGFCVIGAQTGANAMAAESYPTSMRSTGVGWCLGIGRVGSIVGPVVGGLLLSSRISIRGVFWAAAIPPLIASVAAFLLNISKRKKETQTMAAASAAVLGAP